MSTLVRTRLDQKLNTQTELQEQQQLYHRFKENIS
jgi:hypothetical protein